MNLFEEDHVDQDLVDYLAIGGWNWLQNLVCSHLPAFVLEFRIFFEGNLFLVASLLPNAAILIVFYCETL